MGVLWGWVEGVWAVPGVGGVLPVGIMVRLWGHLGQYTGPIRGQMDSPKTENNHCIRNLYLNVYFKLKAIKGQLKAQRHHQ